MLTLKGSEEYISQIMKNWENISPLIRTLNGDVTITESSTVKFDAYMDSDEGYVIIADNLKHIDILVRFAKIQKNAFDKYFETIKLLLKVHGREVNILFNKGILPEEFLDEYSKYMRNLLRFIISSILKEVSLSTDENRELRDEISQIKEALDPLKFKLENKAKLLRYIAIIDHIWRVKLGFKFQDIDNMEPSIEEVEDAFNQMVNAIKKPSAESIKKAAHALTEISLKIFLTRFEVIAATKEHPPIIV